MAARSIALRRGRSRVLIPRPPWRGQTLRRSSSVRFTFCRNSNDLCEVCFMESLSLLALHCRFHMPKPKIRFCSFCSRHPSSPFKIKLSRVERDAPRRVRPPPRQTVRAGFPHTAFHVKLVLSLPPFPHLVQTHCFPLVVVRLRVFQLVPSLAGSLGEYHEPPSHVVIHS